MYFIKNLCFLCLSDDYKLISTREVSSNVPEVFGYIVPEYAFQNSEFPSQICDNCSNSLKIICKFRQKCLESIKTHIAYVQKLKRGNESFENLSIRITDILNNQTTSKDIVNFEKMKSESNSNRKIESELPETDSENMIEQVYDKLSMNEYHLKEKANEKLIIEEDLEEDLNLFEHIIPSSSKNPDVRNEEIDDVYISTDDSTESDSQSLHSDTDSSYGRKRINTIKKPYKCDVCERSFKWISLMKKHHRLHSQERPYICDICQKSFKQNSVLSKHKQTHTNQKPHACDICQASFRDASAMKDHRRLHTGEKPFNCPICQKPFRRLYDMKNHKITHTDEKIYACQICQVSFKNPNALNKHRKTHTDEKPYSCKICHKSIKYRHSLKRHERMHKDIGYTPYKCEICQKSFRDLTYLKRHERTHDDNRIPWDLNELERLTNDFKRKAAS